MRHHLIGPVLALVGALVFPPLMLAQTAEQQGEAKAQTTATTPDLSGLWIRLRDPAHSSLNLDFGNAVSPMTWRATNLSTQLSRADRSDSWSGDHALRVRSLRAPNLHRRAPA